MSMSLTLLKRMVQAKTENPNYLDSVHTWKDLAERITYLHRRHLQIADTERENKRLCLEVDGLKDILSKSEYDAIMINLNREEERRAGEVMRRTKNARINELEDKVAAAESLDALRKKQLNDQAVEIEGLMAQSKDRQDNIDFLRKKLGESDQAVEAKDRQIMNLRKECSESMEKIRLLNSDAARLSGEIERFSAEQHALKRAQERNCEKQNLLKDRIAKLERDRSKTLDKLNRETVMRAKLSEKLAMAVLSTDAFTPESMILPASLGDRIQTGPPPLSL